MKQKKDQRITIRVTPEQYNSICERADDAMMTPSAFVRAAAMRHKIIVIPGLQELTHELKGVGRNLNQLMILAHEGRIQTADLTKVLETLGNIYSSLSTLAQKEQS